MQVLQVLQMQLVSLTNATNVTGGTTVTTVTSVTSVTNRHEFNSQGKKEDCRSFLRQSVIGILIAYAKSLSTMTLLV